MLNLGIRGHDISNKQSIEGLGEEIANQKLNNVQLALGLSFPEMISDHTAINPGMGTYIRDAFRQSNVTVAILSCYINLIHPNQETRQELLVKFASYLEHAKYFGASMVATETGAVTAEIAYTEANFTAEAFEKMVSSVKCLVARAEEHQMTIGLEGGLNHPLYSVEKIADLLGKVDSPYLKIILDPTNLIDSATYLNQNEIIANAFAQFGDKIVALHMKDFQIVDGAIKIVPIGQGLLDVAFILRLVITKRPYIYIIMEETKDEAIASSVAFIKKEYERVVLE